jgi:dihydrofolate reductase
VRRVVVVMQATLNSRIGTGEFGVFWDPFPWGEPEQAWLNGTFRRADTWAMSRRMYEAIVPWWEEVAAGRLPDDVGELHPADVAFASIQHDLRKVVFSSTLEPAADRQVIRGDLAGQLAALKSAEGADIILSCGPRTLAPLAAEPGLIDEYVVAIHPAVVAHGPGLFDGLEADLALELLESRAFEGGAVALRYGVREVRPSGGPLAA